jgi:hypothetical protein
MSPHASNWLGGGEINNLLEQQLNHEDRSRMHVGERHAVSRRTASQLLDRRLGLARDVDSSDARSIESPRMEATHPRRLPQIGVPRRRNAEGEADKPRLRQLHGGLAPSVKRYNETPALSA